MKQTLFMILLTFIGTFGAFVSPFYGVVIYYVFSNAITLVQQYIILRMTGLETELDKFIKKRFGKKPPSDGDDQSARAPAQ